MQVIGVNADMMGVDNTQTVTQFRDQTGVTFPLGFEQTTSYQTFRNSVTSISPYPVDVIVDSTGTIAYLAGDYRADEIIAKLEQLTP